MIVAPQHSRLAHSLAGRMEDRLVWIDLEMTGLDPIENKIIEIATIVTEGDLTLVSEGPSLAISQPESELEKMDDWNITHHTKNGLLKRVRSDGIPIAEAERLTLEFLMEHCLAGVPPLCGNTIGQDRRFLRRYMPELHEFFHYRSVDVTSVKEIARRWYPNAPRFSKPSGHRALDDIRGSIEELAHLRDHVFRD